MSLFRTFIAPGSAQDSVSKAYKALRGVPLTTSLTSPLNLSIPSSHIGFHAAPWTHQMCPCLLQGFALAPLWPQLFPSFLSSFQAHFALSKRPFLTAPLKIADSYPVLFFSFHSFILLHSTYIGSNILQN